ncbi:MAG: YggT family protein [Rudaea sp.]|jgi:YggT family protein
MGQFLLTTVDLLFTALFIVITARVILSWLSPDLQYSQIGRMIRDITEPILQPIRNLLPSMGMMDLSPMIAIIALFVLRTILDALIVGFFPY